MLSRSLLQKKKRKKRTGTLGSRDPLLQVQPEREGERKSFRLRHELLLLCCALLFLRRLHLKIASISIHEVQVPGLGEAGSSTRIKDAAHDEGEGKTEGRAGARRRRKVRPLYRWAGDRTEPTDGHPFFHLFTASSSSTLPPDHSLPAVSFLQSGQQQEDAGDPAVRDGPVADGCGARAVQTQDSWIDMQSVIISSNKWRKEEGGRRAQVTSHKRFSLSPFSQHH